MVLTLLTFWFLWKQCSKKADYNDENLGYVDSAVAVVDSAALVVDSAAAVIDEAAYETYMYVFKLNWTFCNKSLRSI